MPRGWGGDPPADDDEARDRILQAALRCADRLGAEKVGLSDVAGEVGVTRQTVYRLYPSAEALFVAASRAAWSRDLDELADRVAGIEDPADAFVEAITYIVVCQRESTFLSLLVGSQGTEVLVGGMTSPDALDISNDFARRMDVDWSAHGLGDEELAELVRFGLRVIQSLVLDPLRDERPDALRRYLRRWVAPAIRAGIDELATPGDPVDRDGPPSTSDGILGAS